MSITFLSLPYAAILGLCALLYFVVYPVVVYFRDVNGKFDTLYQVVHH